MIELRDHYIKAWVWENAAPGVKVINWDNCQESEFVSGVHFIICETQDQVQGLSRITELPLKEALKNIFCDKCWEIYKLGQGWSKQISPPDMAIFDQKR